MTKQTTSVSIGEIETVRLVCGNCGFTAEMPLDELIRNPRHEQCLACEQRFFIEQSADAIVALEKGFAAFRDAAKSKYENGKVVGIEFVIPD